MSEEGSQNEHLQELTERLVAMVKTGDVAKVESLLNGIHGTTETTKLLLMKRGCLEALESKNLELVKLLFTKEMVANGNMLQESDVKEFLTSALESDFKDGLQYLLSEGLCLETSDWNIVTECVERNRPECLKLLSSLPHINLRRTGEITLLSLAAKKCSPELLEILLQTNAKEDINVQWDEMSPLHYCFDEFIDSKVRLECVRLLLAAGADVNASSSWYTPLSLAGHLRDQPDVALFLLQNGADPFLEGNQLGVESCFTTPNHDDATRSFEFLLERGFDMNTPFSDDGSQNPLHHAVNAGNRKLTLSLLDHKVNINTRFGLNKGSILNLIIFAFREDTGALKEIVDKVLTLNPDVNMADDRKITPLMMAASIGRGEITQRLLKHGADVNAVDNNNKNAAHYYLGSDLDSKDPPSVLLKLLVEAGLNMKNAHLSYFQSAIKGGTVGLVKYLIDMGLDVNQVGENGSNILQEVLWSDVDMELLDVLVSAGVDLNPNSCDRTPLMEACAARNPDMVKYLINTKKCDINMRSQTGKTALHEAVKFCSVDIIKLLIDEGAEVQNQIFDGYTILHLARQIYDRLRLLLHHGGYKLLNFAGTEGKVIKQALYNCGDHNVYVLYQMLAFNCDVSSLKIPEVTCIPRMLNGSASAYASGNAELLFDCGAPTKEIVQFLDEDAKTEFYEYVSNYTLKELCRRVIRTHIGLDVQEKLKILDLPENINEFILMKEIFDLSYFSYSE